MASDFDFKISKNRHLRGRGWGGLIALGMLLFAALVLVAEVRDLWLPMRLYLGL